jgi:hypothetical protein
MTTREYPEQTMIWKVLGGAPAKVIKMQKEELREKNTKLIFI